jgi:protein required for attachment to host cells
MVRHLVTWFVLADGAGARFLKRRELESGYDVVAEYVAPEAHLPSRELVSDRPGHGQESAYSGRHAIEPRQDPHGARKNAFAHEIAAHLGRASAEGAFDRLVIYAAPKTLATLREALDETTRAKVKAEFPKDLMKIPFADLPRHFADHS